MSSSLEQSKALAKHKNKLAQAQYRERQRKKKTDVEQQIAALGKKLAQVQAVNQILESRNSTLEELAAENEQEQAIQDLLGQQAMKASQINSEVRTRELILDWELCLTEYVNATRRYAQPLLTPKELAGHAMSESVVRDLRLNFAGSISQILNNAPSITPEVQEEVFNYVSSTRAVKERLMRCFCHVGALAWKCAKLHTGPNKYNPEVHSLIQLMNLTADQIHALLAARSVHDAGIEAVCQDRLSILKEIRQSMGRPKNVPRGPESKLTSTAEALQLLEENLNAEGRCMKGLWDACNDIISPLQEAVALVQGLSSGLWFEVWDIPCILKQMDLSEIVLVHQPPQDLIQSQQSHLPAVVQPLASETWRLLSIASQPSLKPACNSALSHCSDSQQIPLADSARTK